MSFNEPKLVTDTPNGKGWSSHHLGGVAASQGDERRNFPDIHYLMICFCRLDIHVSTRGFMEDQASKWQDSFKNLWIFRDCGHQTSMVWAMNTCHIPCSGRPFPRRLADWVHLGVGLWILMFLDRLNGLQVHAPALWRAAGNWKQEHWSLEAGEEFLDLQMSFELMQDFSTGFHLGNLVEICLIFYWHP